MANTTLAPKPATSWLRRWLLEDHPGEAAGARQRNESERKHAWWQVMCLTGVDYFSTLGYQPGIAALAAGALAPVATLILVLVTLLCALPIYRNVAKQSPHGEGSISMLEHLLSWWKGKLFVLCLLGFVVTDFIITITLSAADATAHITENPLMPRTLQHFEVAITLLLIVLLGAVFLKGFSEAIGIAVGLVATYLVLNLITIATGLYAIARQPVLLRNWEHALLAAHANPLVTIGVALLLFPKLALGLSGFETGVAVMPLIRGAPDDDEAQPTMRIRNTHKLLLTAALIMSVYLLASSIVTIVLIPAQEFAPGGTANGRALAYLAHQLLGNVFGTIYDISTILILWFAGASAMAGLLNIVPRYLPRYGMAPNWAGAVRPLVLVYLVIAFAVTLIFNANVDAQGGAYATGVLVLMTSAAVAVALSVWRQESRLRGILFVGITLVFIYTTIVNIFERPEGIKIAACFIGAIIMTSFVSRIWRSTELRTKKIELDDAAQAIINDIQGDTIQLIAHRPVPGSAAEFAAIERQQREDNYIPASDPVVFLEVEVRDASEFEDALCVHGLDVDGYHVLHTESSAVPNAIAALLLYLRDTTGKQPHCYFTWTEYNPLVNLGRYLLLGEADTGPVTREVLREAEPDHARRPAIHVGG